MWKLYDELYIGIPSGIRITGCVIGEKWTIVRIDGNIGIARTLELPENADSFASGFVGRFLRDVAGHLYWPTLAHASVGVAAMNAWYNTPERVAGLNGNQKPLPISGKTAYVGDCGGDGAFLLPMTPDFDASVYEKLCDYDNVIIASEALITRALTKLLCIIRNDTNVILEGFSLPATALFSSFGLPVKEIRGYYAKFSDTVEACATINLTDPGVGALPFCIRPKSINRIHESEKTKAALNSTYKSVKFNNYFND